MSSGSDSGALDEATIKELSGRAVQVKERAYAPYSNFKVGAALLTKGGQIFTGCNVENAAYPLTTCAERTAIVKAVSEGHKEFTAIAVATDVTDDYGAPCGSCRQIIVEFGSDVTVILTHKDGSIITKTIQELLPFSFSNKQLRAGQSAT